MGLLCAQNAAAVEPWGQEEPRHGGEEVNKAECTCHHKHQDTKCSHSVFFRLGAVEQGTSAFSRIPLLVPFWHAPKWMKMKMACLNGSLFLVEVVEYLLRISIDDGHGMGRPKLFEWEFVLYENGRDISDFFSSRGNPSLAGWPLHDRQIEKVLDCQLCSSYSFLINDARVRIIGARGRKRHTGCDQHFGLWTVCERWLGLCAASWTCLGLGQQRPHCQHPEQRWPLRIKRWSLTWHQMLIA